MVLVKNGPDKFATYMRKSYSLCTTPTSPVIAGTNVYRHLPRDFCDHHVGIYYSDTMLETTRTKLPDRAFLSPSSGHGKRKVSERSSAGQIAPESDERTNGQRRGHVL